MSSYTRLSIWEDEPHSLSWYDHLVGHKSTTKSSTATYLKARPEATPKSELTQVEDYGDLSYQDEWFRELKARDQRKQISQKNAPTISGLLKSALLVPDRKTLPLDPYFEYMFADAGFTNDSGGSDNSIDNLSISDSNHPNDNPLNVNFLTAPSPPETQPSTPEPDINEVRFVDVAAFLQLELCETDASTAANALCQDKLATVSGNAEDNYSDSKLASVYEHTDEAVSSQSCRHSQDTQISIPPLRRELSSQTIGLQRSPDRPILLPKSQKVKCAQPARDKLRKTSKGQPISVLQAREDIPAKGANKRNADKLDTDNVAAHLNENVCRKKLRLCSDNQDTSNIEVESVSVSSDIPSPRRASEDFFNHKPLAIAPKGYAGQFDGMVINQNFVADFKFNLPHPYPIKSGLQYTFGDLRHPNGTYTHTSIIFDPRSKTPDFAKEHLPTDHPLLTCMDFATEMTIAACDANIVKLRTNDEEILRRESHLECAHARLEGVAVGYYRYYQGHLSVEEYYEAEMCIC